MTTTSAINTDINTFIASQNQGRGQTLAGGGMLPLDYNALSGTVPAGGNSVTGIAGIAASAPAISLPTANGNAVIVDGGISTTASTSGADSYSLLANTSGSVTLTDNNTGNSETVTGASYFLFDGAATMSTGAYQSLYIVETGTNAEMAAMYNAAFGRVPDLAGLEFYIDQYGTSALPDLHTMATYFEASAEFKTLYPALQTASDNGGPHDQAFINQLYGQILHRTPSASEVQYYVDALQGTLTTPTGAAIPAADRATLLEYFTNSPENQADISAANGGWLINPANGAVSLGAMSPAAVSAVLTSQVASGTINASDFTNMSTSGQVLVPDAAITGGEYGAGTPNQQSDPEIATEAPNVTVNLSSQYYLGAIFGPNETLNGVPTGSTIVELVSYFQDPTYVNNGGTVNLFGNVNWVLFGNPSYAVTVPATINGWNSTDILLGEGGHTPYYGATAASLLANPDGEILIGTASNPVNGASISNTTYAAVAINVGSIANDSVAAIVTAANQAFHENGNTLTSGDVNYVSTFFFGEDPQGNTMVWYWRGDTNNSGTVQASDITGGVELVGVHASSLTGTNFHQ
jgi:hypothetical protein